MLKEIRLLSIIILIILSAVSCHKTNVINLGAMVKEKVFPTHSFVQVLKKLHIYECAEGSECKPGQYTSAGSGISIGNSSSGTLIVTASHVCNLTLNEASAKILTNYKIGLDVKTISGAVLNAEIVHASNLSDGPLDLCLLYIKDLFLPGVPISKNGPEVGDRVFSISAPEGVFEPPTVPLLDGFYSGPMPDGASAMITIPATGGSSGAAVLNKKMELVGIIFAVKSGFRHITLASKFQSTVRFLNKSINIFINKHRTTN